MNTNRKTTSILEDVKINVKIKLSVLWATVMFLYLYVDVFGFFRPGFIEEVITGEVAGFQITQVWLLGVIVLMTIPSLMVFLSIALKAKWNRWANIIVGILQIAINLGFLIGETYAFYIFGTLVEAVLLSLIVWYAWKWPKQERVEATP
jgi:hypothetical protein